MRYAGELHRTRFRSCTASIASKRSARNAVVVGSDGADLHFTSVRLAGTRRGGATATRGANAAQGETRSHGFFYRRKARTTAWSACRSSAAARPRGRTAAPRIGVAALPAQPVAHASASSARSIARRRVHERLPRGLVRRLVRQLAAALRPQPRVRADGLRDRRRPHAGKPHRRSAARQLRAAIGRLRDDLEITAAPGQRRPSRNTNSWLR